MAWYFFIVMGHLLAGVILATVWWLFWGRRKGIAGGILGATTVVAGLILVLGMLASQAISLSVLVPLDLPIEFWYWHSDFRFTIPLLLGIAGLVLLAFPVRGRPGRGTAELTPRTAMSFVRRWWFVTPAVVLALTLAITITTGAASEPDPRTGHYTMYSVDVGREMSMGTSIYGWYNSVPCLILIGVLIVAALVNLSLIARPAFDRDHDRDVHLRVVRSRNVLAVVTGALLLHFGLILRSLAGTASLSAEFSTSVGRVSVWTTFAALQPVFTVAAEIVAAFGIAFWAAVALSALSSRRRSASVTQAAVSEATVQQ